MKYFHHSVKNKLSVKQGIACGCFCICCFRLSFRFSRKAISSDYLFWILGERNCFSYFSDMSPQQGWQHRGAGDKSHSPPLPFATPLFCVANRRKGNNEKRLSPRSKCYCFSHSRASRIQKKFFLRNHGGQLHFSVFHSSSTLNFISPTLDKLLANYFGA